MYIDSIEFAQHLIYKARKHKIDMNVTKLNKLFYITDGLLLASDLNVIKEHAQAWNYGPVYPKVYKWIMRNEEYLSNNNDDCNYDNDTLREYLKEKSCDKISIEKIVEFALETFGTYSANTLSDWSHQNDSPWSLALDRCNRKYGCAIDKLDMKDYFKKFMK